MATKKDDKVFDVAKPGTTSPQTGSRPMVAGHKSSIVSDPTLKGETDKVSDEEVSSVDQKNEEKPLEQPTKKVLRPLTDEEKETDQKQEQVDEAQAATDAESSSRQQDIESKESDKTTEDNKTAREAPKVDAKEQEKPEELTREEKQEKKEKDADDIQLERENKLNEIIKSKEYILPIKERSAVNIKSYFVGFIVFVIIVLTGLYILIDTETIDIGIEPPFDIFGSSEPVAQQVPVEKPSAVAEEVSATKIYELAGTQLALTYDETEWSLEEQQANEVDGNATFSLKTDPSYRYTIRSLDTLENNASAIAQNQVDEIISYSAEPFDLYNTEENTDAPQLFFFKSLIKRTTSTQEFYFVSFGLSENETLQQASAQGASNQWQDAQSSKYITLTGVDSLDKNTPGYKTLEEAQARLDDENFIAVEMFARSLGIAQRPQ